MIDDVEYQYSSVTIGDVTVAARENFRDDPELNTNTACTWTATAM